MNPLGEFAPNAPRTLKTATFGTVQKNAASNNICRKRIVFVPHLLYLFSFHQIKSYIRFEADLFLPKRRLKIGNSDSE
jgi:hypothetical protein